jgi:putative transposase
MKKKIKEYSSDFKTKVVLEYLRGEANQTELSQKYGMPTCTIRTWIAHFLDNADSVFEDKRRDKEAKGKMQEKEKQIEQLHKMVGELTVENNWIKKKHKEFGIPLPKEYDY